MRKCLKKLASCKLGKPATVKICGTTTPLHEIAKRGYGILNGAWSRHSPPDGLPRDHVALQAGALMPFRRRITRQRGRANW
jgi:hypothetical protein